MLPQKQRLRRHEVNFVFKKGSSQKTSFFLVKSMKDTKAPDALPRFAVLIPKKMYTTIVQRNALRRKAYYLIQKDHASWAPGTWYVVTLLTQ